MLENDAGRWLSFGASLTGSRHLQRGEANQDAWISQHWDWGDLIVVCDGLGSMPHARRGAQAACAAVSLAAWELAADKEFRALPERIHTHWLKQVQPLEPELSGTTCLFALVTADSAWLGQLGDGMVCAVGEQSVLLPVDNEFLNVTCCLGLEHTPLNWQFARYPVMDFSGIVLTTDGLSADIPENRQAAFARDLLKNYGPMPPGARITDLQQMLASWPILENYDDKTLACLWRSTL